MKAYEFKITLRRKRGVWRKFVVPAGIKFEQLHDVIQVAMGWDNCHLYDFRFSNPSLIITTPDFDIYGAMAIAKKADAETIDKYVEEQRKFLYVYDFGDNWEHRIELLKIIDDYPDAYPKVLSFKGNCPLEDSGGYFDDPDKCNEELSEGEGEKAQYNLSEVNSYMQEALVLKKIKV